MLSSVLPVHHHRPVDPYGAAPDRRAASAARSSETGTLILFAALLQLSHERLLHARLCEGPGIFPGLPTFQE